MSESLILFAIFFGVYNFIFWITSPILCSRYIKPYRFLSTNQRAKVHSGIAGIFNTAFCCIFASCAFYGGEVTSIHEGRVSTFTKVIAANGLSYVCFDLQTTFFQKVVSTAGLGIVVHHLICGLAYAMIMSNLHFGYYMVVRTLSEIVQPFLFFRWYLININKEQSRAYTVNAILTVLTFFLSRICIIPAFWLHLANDDVVADYWRKARMETTVLTSICAGLDVLNIYWFSLMIKGAIRLFSRNSQC